MLIFFLSFIGWWVLSNYVIFHYIKVSKHIWDPCCFVVTESGSWFILLQKCYLKIPYFKNTACWLVNFLVSVCSVYKSKSTINNSTFFTNRLIQILRGQQLFCWVVKPRTYPKWLNWQKLIYRIFSRLNGGGSPICPTKIGLFFILLI